MSQQEKTKKKTKEKPPKPKVPWQDSKARKLLYKDIVDGLVDDHLPPRVVIRMRPEYDEYQEYFANYLRTLRMSIKKNKDNAALASRAVQHDRRVMLPFASKDYPPWRRSEADVSLKADIADKLHERLKPKELYESRPEYKDVYPLRVFRNHIYQEVNSERESSYWLHRNAKKTNKNKKTSDKEEGNEEPLEHRNRYFDYNYESYRDAQGQEEDEYDSNDHDAPFSPMQQYKMYAAGADDEVDASDEEEEDKSSWNSRNNMAFI